MTKEEWVAAYVLQFGPQQAFRHGFASGEHDFLDTMEKDLSMDKHFDGLSCIQRELGNQGYGK